MKVGTEVKFFCRGKREVGVVAGYHLKRRRGRVRQLAELVTGDPSSLDIEQVVIVSTTENTYWGIGAGDLTATGKTISERDAINRLNDVKRAIAASKANARKRRVEASDVDWWKVDEGTLIEVKFSDIGWTRAIYLGQVRSSGNVRFEYRGRLYRNNEDE